MSDTSRILSRRDMLTTVAALSTAATLPPAIASTAVAASAQLTPPSANQLNALLSRLARAPRRRSFNALPMILTDPGQWDDEALQELFAYPVAYKQVVDNTDIAGLWLDRIGTTLNAQIWSFRHPDFLSVSATHGTAQIALYDQITWDKYQLARLAGGSFKRNTLIEATSAAAGNPADFEDPAGVFSPADNTIPALMRRGVVFLACHDEAWQLAGSLRHAGINPDRRNQQQLTAELINHLIPGVILTPNVTATLSELVRVGFQYLK